MELAQCESSHKYKMLSFHILISIFVTLTNAANEASLADKHQTHFRNYVQQCLASDNSTSQWLHWEQLEECWSSWMSHQYDQDFECKNLTLKPMNFPSNVTWTSCESDSNRVQQQVFPLDEWSRGKSEHNTSHWHQIFGTQNGSFTCFNSSLWQFQEAGCQCMPISLQSSCSDNTTLLQSNVSSPLPLKSMHPCQIWQFFLLRDAGDFWTFVFWKQYCCQCNNKTSKDSPGSEANPEEPCEATECLPDEEFIRCPLGEVYCMEFGFCASECNPSFDEVTSIEEDFQCPEGTAYSLETGMCMQLESRALWKSDDDLGGEYINDDGCIGHRSYCPAINACADNCDLIARSLQDDDDFFFVCNDGYVFDVTTRSCIFPNAHQMYLQYENAEAETTNHVCQQGYIFCLETGDCRPIKRGCSAIKMVSEAEEDCSSEAEDCQRCPAVANVNEEAFSSCSVDFHCPGDEICCPNKGGHFHCSEAVAAVIAGGNTTTLPKDNLAKVCSDHSPTWSFELALSASNHNCTQDSPDSCPVSTLCCNEKCYGFYANDDLNAIQLSDFKCQGSLLCQRNERCLGLKEFGKECSLKDIATAKLYPLGCQESFSRISLLESVPKEFNVTQCFNVSGIEQGCLLEIKVNHTIQHHSSSAMEICLGSTSAGNTLNQLSLSCAQQCLTKHKIQIEQKEKAMTLLLTFGLDSPLVQFNLKNTRKQLRLREEAKHYNTHELFGIELNKEMKAFLTKVCFSASEDIGFDNFNLTNDNYALYLAQLCIALTNDTLDLSSYKLQLNLKDLKSKSHYEECYIEYLNESSHWLKLPFEEPVTLPMMNGQLRGANKGSEKTCRLNLQVKPGEKSTQKFTFSIEIMGSQSAPMAKPNGNSAWLQKRLYMPCPQSRKGQRRRTPKGIRAGDIAGYFFADDSNENCRNCSICIVYAASRNTDFGCWQYSGNEGTFSCLQQHSLGLDLAEIEGFTRSRWNTFAKMNDYQANLTCLHSEARLRFVRKSTRGSYDPLLSWKIEEGIEFGGLLFLPWYSNDAAAEGQEASDGSFMLEYDEISSPRLGYIYAQQAHCKSKEAEVAEGESVKNPRKQRKLPLLPCDGVLGSNASLNKCGHCYTDPSEADMHVNDCGGCFDQPCCKDSQKNACGQCSEKACDSNNILKIVKGQVQDLVCSRSIVSAELNCPGNCWSAISNTSQLQCFLESENGMMKSSLEIEFYTGVKFRAVFKDVSVGKYHVRCGLQSNDTAGSNLQDGQNLQLMRTSIEPMLVVNSGLTLVNNVTTKQSPAGKGIEIELELDEELPQYLPKKYLNCFVHKAGLSNRLTSRLVKVKEINGKKVLCKPVKLASNFYQAGLVTNSGSTSSSIKPCLHSALFTWQNVEGPKVTEAFWDFAQGLMVVGFDTNVECLHQDECLKVFDLPPEQGLNSTLSCLCKGDNKLLVKIEKEEAMHFIGRNSSKTLIFSKDNGIIQAGDDPSLAAQTKPGFPLKIRRRGGKNLQKNLAIFGSSVFCYTEPKCFRVRLGNGGRKGKQAKNQNKLPDVTTSGISVKVSKNSTQVFEAQNVTLTLNENANSWRQGRTNRRKSGGKGAGRRFNQLCPGFEDEISPGSYSIIIENEGDVASWEFVVKPEDSQYVTDVKIPRRAVADGTTKLKTITKTCGNMTSQINVNSTAFKYEWKSEEDMDADIDIVDSPHLELSKGSLQGGKTYHITSTVLLENLTGNHTLSTAESTVALEVQKQGVKAAIVPTELKIGKTGRGTLSGRLSEDLDNSDIEWTFDWYCMTDKGSACPANDGSSTLETLIGSDLLRKPDLQIDGQMLLPGNYIFTLMATKSNQRSEANASVTIVPQDLPSIHLLSPQSLVLPYRKFIATAMISAPQGTCLWWTSVAEEGFATYNMHALKSSSKKCFNNADIQSQPFYLIIPASKKKGLQPGLKYKFEINAESPQGGIGQSNFIVETLADIHVDGIFLEASSDDAAKSGIALNTFFTISLSEEVTSNAFSQLTFKFGWKHGLDDEPNFLQQTLSSDDDPSEINTQLPPGLSENDHFLLLTCQVCNELEVCQDVGPAQVQVRPRSVDKLELREIIEDIDGLYMEKKCPAAVSKSRVLLATLESDESVWSDLRNAACGAFFRLIRGCMIDLQHQLYSGAGGLNEAKQLLSNLMMSECRLIDNNLLHSDRLAAYEAAAQLLANVQSSLQKSVLKKLDIPSETSNREPRIKRSIDNSVEVMETQDILKSLMTKLNFERQTFLFGLDIIQNKVTEIANATVKQMQALRDGLTVESTRDACPNLTPEDEPLRATIESLDMTITKFTTDWSSKSFSIPQTGKIHSGNKISLSNAVIEEYLDQTLCLAIATFNTDIITPSSESFEPMKNISKLLVTAYVKFLTENNEDLSSLQNNLLASGSQRKKRAIVSDDSGINQDSNDNLQLDIEVNQSDLEDGLYLRCLVFYNDEWNMTLCQTSSITTSGDVATVHCECSVDGYLAVGLVTASDNELVYVEEIYTFEKTLSFKIDEDYDTKVKGNEAAFRANLRQQIMDLIDVESNNIKEISLAPGSIIVDILLVGRNELEADQLNEAYNQLVTLIEAGELQIFDENGDLLKVPKQCIETCDDAVLIKDEDLTILIVGTVVLGIILFVLICIFAGVLAKKRNQSEKMKRLISPNRSDELNPSYRNMAFIDNMDGTADKLQQYRRNPTMTTSSPMMPLPAVYQGMRMQSNSSVQLQDADSEKGTGNESIPGSARYNEPSRKQQLESSQKISENLTRKLPGTPE